MEILILRHKNAAMCLGKRPNLFVGRTPETELTNMQGVWEIVAQQPP